MFKKIFLAFVVFLKILKFFLFSPQRILLFIKKVLTRFRVKGIGWVVSLYFEKIKGMFYAMNVHQAWIDNFESVNRIDRKTISEFIKKENLPYFSIVMVAEKEILELVLKSVHSIINQSYPFWEIIVVQDPENYNASTVALEEFLKKDLRLRLVEKPNGKMNFVNSLNLALENSNKEFISVLRVGDTLDHDALYEIAKVISENESIDIVYSDEDEIDSKENRFNPSFKPGWSPELLLSTMYVKNAITYRKEIIVKVGLFRTEFEFAHNYDLLLRATELTQQIHHISKILYHARPNRPSSSLLKKSLQAQKGAITAALARRGLTGTVEEVNPMYPGNWKVKIDVIGSPKVSIIIPTAGKSGIVGGKKIHYLLNCIKSIIEKSSYKNLEIVISHNGDLAQEVEMQLAKVDQVVLIHYDKKEFNLSEKMNLTVEAATGDYVIIFNDDIEVISPDWIENMLGFAQLDGVGAVGAKLLFEDRSVQHLGVVWFFGGPGHINYKDKEFEYGHGNINLNTHNMLAVTGACMMVRKSVFIKMNSWDLNFPLNYNDVDFCVQLNHSGYRNVLCPHTVLFHYESASKEGTDIIELLLLISKWGNVNDPYYNPNYSWEINKILKLNYETWLLKRIGDRKKRYLLKSEPLSFSIITPVFNTNKKFLTNLATTILKQTYKSFEWVIVDNGSSDKDTLAALEKISVDKRVKLIRSKTNLGIIAGTQLGFQNSTGNYVLPVDHDDLIAYDALQIMAYYIMKNNYPAILYSDEDKLNSIGRNDSPFFKTDFDPVMFFNNCYIAHLCAFHRETGVKLNVYSDRNAEGCHDWDTLYRFIRNGSIPFHVPEILYSWRVHSLSTASGVAGVKPYTVTSQYYVLRKQLEFLKKEKDYDLIENNLTGYTGMWSIKRKTNFSKKIAIYFDADGKNTQPLNHNINIIQKDCNYESDIYISRNLNFETVFENYKSTYTKGNIFLSNLFDNEEKFTTYDYIFFVSDKIFFKSMDSLDEALSMFGFFDDSVLISGRIQSEEMYLYADSYFDRDSNVLNSGFGNSLLSTGYGTARIVQKSAEVVSEDFWSVRSDFLKEVFLKEKPNVEPRHLNYALSAIAKNNNRRVIYSPYIDLEIKNKKESNYSSLIKNPTNYKVQNFKYQYSRITDTINESWVTMFEQELI